MRDLNVASPDSVSTPLKNAWETKSPAELAKSYVYFTINKLQSEMEHAASDAEQGLTKEDKTLYENDIEGLKQDLVRVERGAEEDRALIESYSGFEKKRLAEIEESKKQNNPQK